jgi:hypothetical protein
VCPDVEIGLGEIELRIREGTRPVVGHQTPAMIAMRMSENHCVDVLGLDACGLQIGWQLACVRAHHLR